MNENFTGVGQRIEQKIKELKLKQIDVSKATGISKNAMSNYISGNRIPDTLAIYKLARFFSVSIEWLLTGEEYFSKSESKKTFSPSLLEETNISDSDLKLIQALLLLNDRQKGKIEERIDMLLSDAADSKETSSILKNGEDAATTDETA